ncbi:hypothetical protein D3C84_205480 [compost metagenome]
MCGGLADLRQPRDLSIELEALQLFAFGRRQFFVGRGRRQPREFVGGHRLRQYQRGDFFRQVGRLTEIQQAENQRRVFRLPVFRLVTGGGKVCRQLVAVAEQVSIDPARIDFKEALEPRRRRFVQLTGIFLQVDGAHVAVGIQQFRAVHFGEAALSKQAQGGHLRDAVAGVHITEGEQCVVEAVAFDQRHAHGIASHGNVLRQTLERLHARGRREGVLGVESLTTGQAQNTGHCCGNAEPGKKMCEGWRGHGKAPAGGSVSKGATLVSRRWPRKRGRGLFAYFCRMEKISACGSSHISMHSPVGAAEGCDLLPFNQAFGGLIFCTSA